MRRSVWLFALLTISRCLPSLRKARDEAAAAPGVSGGAHSGGSHSGGGHGFPGGGHRGYSRYRNYGGFYAPGYYPYWDGGWDEAGTFPTPLNRRLKELLLR